jgi:hypothetical protein
MKTKKINNVDCPRHSFAYAPDENNIENWALPLWIPGDVKKSVNAIKTSLHRFNEAKMIPESERFAVWFTLYGALRAHGFDIERRTFAATNEVPTPTAEPKDALVESIVAEADRRASALLRSLGLE